MTVNREWKVDLVMNGSSTRVVTIPHDYKYISIVNGTPNTIEVYVGATTPAMKQNNALLVSLPSYQMITLPIFNDVDYTFIYTDGGGTNPKHAQVYFSDVSLNLNGSIGAAGVQATVTLGTDNIGLAKAAQLPGALGASGGLKVERLDTGRATGRATALGVTAIKNAPGKVWAIVCVTAGVTATLRDGAAAVWAANSATPGNFPVPIACNTSIVIDLSAAGEAYVLYE